jgi:hypothetical protein
MQSACNERRASGSGNLIREAIREAINMQSACNQRRASGSGNLEALPHQACVSLRLRRRCRRCRRRRRCLLLRRRRRRRRRRHRPRGWPPSRLPPLPNREYPVEARRSTARSSRTPGRVHRCRVWNSSARMHTCTRAPVIACNQASSSVIKRQSCQSSSHAYVYSSACDRVQSSVIIKRHHQASSSVSHGNQAPAIACAK